eukprot:scaffold8926_cov154-Skeletonema_dohrnii-CCMP3373.AAC.3
MKLLCLLKFRYIPAEEKTCAGHHYRSTKKRSASEQHDTKQPTIHILTYSLQVILPTSTLAYPSVEALD